MPKITERFRCVGMLFTERTTQDDVLGALDFKNREFLGEDLERELGMFDDNWRHNTNICKACVKSRQKSYKGKTTREGRILNDQH